MLQKNFIAISTLLLLLFSPLSLASQNINWHGQIKAKKIVINNQYGDVRLRYGGDKNYVEYVAVQQNKGSEGELYIRKNETDNVFYISVDSKNINKNVKVIDSARIDISVFIPKNIFVKVQTAKGTVNAKGLKSDLQVHTESGNIYIHKHSGLLNTKNNTGNTKIVLKKHDYEQKQRFESIYGKIHVTISNKSNVLVNMSTSGNITSDFSLDMIKNNHLEPNKTAVIKNNNASSNVVIFSKRGDVALKEYVEFN